MGERTWRVKNGNSGYTGGNPRLAVQERAERPQTAARRRFPLLMRQAEAEGCPHDFVMDVLDEWLNYGYCRLIDPITQDIEITPEGRLFFY